MWGSDIGVRVFAPPLATLNRRRGRPKAKRVAALGAAAAPALALARRAVRRLVRLAWRLKSAREHSYPTTIAAFPRPRNWRQACL